MLKKFNLSRHLRQGHVNRVQIVLASSSPYRRELLQRLNLEFVTEPPEIDETPLSLEAPQSTARRLAETKARAVAAHHPNAYVLGSDQVAVIDGELLGKPGTRDAALAQLSTVRGRKVVFHTAICVLDSFSGRCQIAEVPTAVYF